MRAVGNVGMRGKKIKTANVYVSAAVCSMSRQTQVHTSSSSEWGVCVRGGALSIALEHTTAITQPQQTGCTHRQHNRDTVGRRKELMV